MATTVLPAPHFQDESPPPRSFSPLTLPSRPSMEASSMKSRKSLLDIFVSARRPTPAPSGSKLKLSTKPPENAAVAGDMKAAPNSDVPNRSPPNLMADAVQPAEKNPLQRPRSKSRTILQAISTKFRSRSPISPTSPSPLNTSLQAKQNREAALRERGLLPPLQPKDLSRLEAERDRHTPIVLLDQASADGSGEPSAADLIKREWEAKHKALVATTTPSPDSTGTDERERLRSFRFGSPSPKPGEQPSQAHELGPVKDDLTPLPSPLSDDGGVEPPEKTPELELGKTKESQTSLPSPLSEDAGEQLARAPVILEPIKEVQTPLPSPVFDDDAVAPPVPEKDLQLTTSTPPPPPPVAVTVATEHNNTRSDPSQGPPPASPLPTPPPTPSEITHQHSPLFPPTVKPPSVSSHPPQRDDVASSSSLSGHKQSGSHKSSLSAPPAPVISLTPPPRVDSSAEEPVTAEAQRGDVEPSLSSGVHIRSGSQKSSSSAPPTSVAQPRADAVEEPAVEVQRDNVELLPGGHSRSGSQKSSSSAPPPSVTPPAQPRVDATEEPAVIEEQRKGIESSLSVHSRSGSQKSLPPVPPAPVIASTPPRTDSTGVPTATEAQRNEHTRSGSQKSSSSSRLVAVTPPRADSTKESATGAQRDDVRSFSSSSSGHNRSGSQKSSSSIPLTPVISLTPPRPESTDEPPSSSVVSLPHRRSESLTKMPSISETVSSIMTPSLETSSRTTTATSSVNTVESQCATPGVPKGKIGLLKVKAPEHNIPMIIESPVEDTFMAEPEGVNAGEIPLPLSPKSEGHDQSLTVPVQNSLLTRRGRGFTDPGKQEKRKSFNPFRRTIVAEPDDSGVVGGSGPKKLSVVTSFGNLRRAASSLTRPRSTYAPSVAPSSKTTGAQTYDASHLPPSPTLPSRFNLSPGFGSGVGGKNSMEIPPPRRTGVQPTLHSRGSILMEASAIQDDETRRMTELAFLN